MPQDRNTDMLMQVYSLWWLPLIMIKTGLHYTLKTVVARIIQVHVYNSIDSFTSPLFNSFHMFLHLFLEACVNLSGCSFGSKNDLGL